MKDVAVVTKPPSGAAPAPQRRDFAKALRRQQITGLAVIAFFAGTLGVWSMTTMLQGAVHASGQFVIASEVKKVQHPSGGVVGELLVKDGDTVRAGDIVMRLDDTIVRSNYQILSKQLDEFAVRSVRLEAERDGKTTLEMTPEILARVAEPEIAKLIAAETRLFEVRRSARDGQRAQLRKRIVQLGDEITGLKAQLSARIRQAEIIKTELQGVEELFKRNLVQLPRLSALQREQANLEGQRGQLIATIAQSEGRIAETDLQIIQIDEDQRAEVMKELREIQARQAELVERRTAAQDQLKRIDLRSPSAGVVHQLAVHTIGGVVPAGEAVMLIVPSGEELEVDAKVSPTDIDQISLGQTARVKIQAGYQPNTPELIGTLSRISADVSRDERQGLVYYTVRITLPKSELEHVAPLKVIAGMQAEVFIETVPRSPIAFLTKPLRDQFDRTFRER